MGERKKYPIPNNINGNAPKLYFTKHKFIVVLLPYFTYMDKDEFLKKLIAFITDNSSELHPKVFKNKIRFGINKSSYTEMRFDYSQNYKGFYLQLASYNKEVGDFFEQEMGNAFLKMLEDESKEFRNLFFVQNSFQLSHYYYGFPIMTNDNTGHLCPEMGTTIFNDVLRNLQANHFKFIQAAEVLSPDLLHYIKRFPSCFLNTALVALLIIEKNLLSLDDERVQGLFEYDNMVTKNECKLFSPFDLIFGKKDYQQTAKQRILQRK